MRAPHALAAIGCLVLASGPLAASARAEVPSAVRPGEVPEPQGLHQGPMHGYTPNAVTGGKVVTTPELAALIARVHPILLNVAEKDRKPPSMGAGMVWRPLHRSLPDAVFLEGGGNGTDDSAYAGAFQRRVAQLAGDDKGRAIVTFCHPDCWGSYNAAKRLVALGYTNIYWYRDGVEGWQADHDTRIVKPDAAWLDSLPKDVTQ